MGKRLRVETRERTEKTKVGFCFFSCACSVCSVFQS